MQSELNTSIGAMNTDIGGIAANVTAAQAAQTAAELAETNAATSESNAATSESNAATSESNAATSESNAAATYDAFDDRYLGAKASDPALDNDGNALLTGAQYFNTTTDTTRVYNGSGWQDSAAIATSVTVSQISDLTATAAEINTLDGITATTAELNYLDITTLGATEASKAVTADANGVVTFDNGKIEESTVITSSSNAATLNLTDGDNFTHTLTENVTYTFSNPAASGKVSAFSLKVTQDTTARTITWPSSVDWAAATAPTLTATSGGVDVFVFVTYDGGTNYYGFTAGQAMG